MAGGKGDCEEGSIWVEALREEVRGEGEGADVIEKRRGCHGGGCERLGAWTIALH